LKPRAEAAQNQETAEMLDKLKGLGNNILGTLLNPYSILILNLLSQGILVCQQIISSLSLMAKEVIR
jgi:hypothetical protein